MNILTQAIRALLFLVLAFFGLIMAFVFMTSTLLAIGVLYVVARIQGRPFGVRAYWDDRRQAAMRARAGMRPGAGAGRPDKPRGRSRSDVVDVEMREIP